MPRRTTRNPTAQRTSSVCCRWKDLDCPFVPLFEYPMSFNDKERPSDMYMLLQSGAATICGSEFKFLSRHAPPKICDSRPTRCSRTPALRGATWTELKWLCGARGEPDDAQMAHVRAVGAIGRQYAGRGAKGSACICKRKFMSFRKKLSEEAWRLAEWRSDV